MTDEPRIVTYSSKEEPLLTATDAIHQQVVERLTLHDEIGQYADIDAVCCRRCGYTQEFATVLGTHRCTTPARQDRLAAKGMEIFRDVVARQDSAAWRQVAERLAFQLSDALHILKTQAGISDLRSDEGGSAEQVLADFLAMLPSEQRQSMIGDRGVVIPLKRRT